MAKPDQMPVGYFGWSLVNGERGSTTLKDVLHNLSASENGDRHDYGKGVLMGVVSTLVACGMTYDDAMQLAWQHMPNDVHPARVPINMKEKVGNKLAKL